MLRSFARSTAFAAVVELIASAATCRGVHRAPAVDDSRAEALEQTTIALAARDCDRLGRERQGAEQPFAAFSRLLVHVRDLHFGHAAACAADVERTSGIVGVDVCLQRALVAHDEQWSPSSPNSVWRARPFEALALHDETRAVAITRRGQMDSLGRQRALSPRGRLRQRVAPQRSDDAAEQLQHAGGPGVDDACLGEGGQHRLRAPDAVFAAHEQCVEVSTLLCELPDQREHRSFRRVRHPA